MKFEPEDLESIDAWIVGSKAKGEALFFHQIVYRLSHKQKLWQHFKTNDIDFFFLEIKLPARIATEDCPF